MVIGIVVEGLSQGEGTLPVKHSFFILLFLFPFFLPFDIGGYRIKSKKLLRLSGQIARCRDAQTPEKFSGFC
jgi:hypothetical protein